MTARGRRVPLARWTLTWATARRVLAPLRHDPRTIAMMIAIPAVLMILLRYVLNNPVALNRFAPELIGVFPFIVMFIVAAVTSFGSPLLRGIDEIRGKCVELLRRERAAEGLRHHVLRIAGLDVRVRGRDRLAGPTGAGGREHARGGCAPPVRACRALRRRSGVPPGSG